MASNRLATFGTTTKTTTPASWFFFERSSWSCCCQFQICYGCLGARRGHSSYHDDDRPNAITTSRAKWNSSWWPITRSPWRGRFSSWYTVPLKNGHDEVFNFSPSLTTVERPPTTTRVCSYHVYEKDEGNKGAALAFPGFYETDEIPPGGIYPTSFYAAVCHNVRSSSIYLEGNLLYSGRSWN